MQISIYRCKVTVKQKEKTHRLVFLVLAQSNEEAAKKLDESASGKLLASLAGEFDWHYPQMLGDIVSVGNEQAERELEAIVEEKQSAKPCENCLDDGFVCTICDEPTSRCACETGDPASCPECRSPA